MVPPPATPSPHRFVIKNPKRPPQPRRPPPVPSAQQFNATPRFHFAPSQRNSVSDGWHREGTPLAHQYPTPARPRDTIEDTLGVADFDVHESIESDGPNFALDHFSEDEDDGHGARRRSTKRRRLSASPILGSQDVVQQDENPDGRFPRKSNELETLISSANSAMSSPPAEPLHRPSGSTAPRFFLPLTPAPVPSSTPATIQTAAFAKPPRFRPPDDQEQQQRPREPLPDAFSPQRRGQRFLGGGLAAEVVGWVMNLESSAHATSSVRSEEDTWVAEFVVDEVRGGPGAGMTLISGRQIHTAQITQGGAADALGVVKVILAGSGNLEGFQKAVKVDVRKKIRIKRPVWEAVIEGEKWGVAVTWEVLS